MNKSVEFKGVLASWLLFAALGLLSHSTTTAFGENQLACLKSPCRLGGQACKGFSTSIRATTMVQAAFPHDLVSASFQKDTEAVTLSLVTSRIPGHVDVIVSTRNCSTCPASMVTAGTCPHGTIDVTLVQRQHHNSTAIFQVFLNGHLATTVTMQGADDDVPANVLIWGCRVIELQPLLCAQSQGMYLQTVLAWATALTADEVLDIHQTQYNSMDLPNSAATEHLLGGWHVSNSTVIAGLRHYTTAGTSNWQPEACTAEATMQLHMVQEQPINVHLLSSEPAASPGWHGHFRHLLQSQPQCQSAALTFVLVAIANVFIIISLGLAVFVLHLRARLKSFQADIAALQRRLVPPGGAGPAGIRPQRMPLQPAYPMGQASTTDEGISLSAQLSLYDAAGHAAAVGAHQSQGGAVGTHLEQPPQAAGRPISVHPAAAAAAAAAGGSNLGEITFARMSSSRSQPFHAMSVDSSLTFAGRAWASTTELAARRAETLGQPSGAVDPISPSIGAGYISSKGQVRQLGNFDASVASSDRVAVAALPLAMQQLHGSKEKLQYAAGTSAAPAQLLGTGKADFSDGAPHAAFESSSIGKMDIRRTSLPSTSPQIAVSSAATQRHSPPSPAHAPPHHTPGLHRESAPPLSPLAPSDSRTAVPRTRPQQPSRLSSSHLPSTNPSSSGAMSPPGSSGTAGQAQARFTPYLHSSGSLPSWDSMYSTPNNLLSTINEHSDTPYKSTDPATNIMDLLDPASANLQPAEPQSTVPPLATVPSNAPVGSSKQHGDHEGRFQKGAADDEVSGSEPVQLRSHSEGTMGPRVPSPFAMWPYLSQPAASSLQQQSMQRHATPGEAARAPSPETSAAGMSQSAQRGSNQSPASRLESTFIETLTPGSAPLHAARGSATASTSSSTSYSRQVSACSSSNGPGPMHVQGDSSLRQQAGGLGGSSTRLQYSVPLQQGSMDTLSLLRPGAAVMQAGMQRAGDLTALQRGSMGGPVRHSVSSTSLQPSPRQATHAPPAHKPKSQPLSSFSGRGNMGAPATLSKYSAAARSREIEAVEGVLPADQPPVSSPNGSTHRGLYRGMSGAIEPTARGSSSGQQQTATSQPPHAEAHAVNRVQHTITARIHGGNPIPPSGFIAEAWLGKHLGELIHSQTGPLPLSMVLRIGMDIALALQQLHPTIIHGDLKPAHVLMGQDMVAKISDSSIARLKITSQGSREDIADTVAYMAPELFQDQPITPKADIYSWAVVMWEMMTAEFPWHGMSNMGVVYNIVFKGERLQLPKQCPPELGSLIRCCWHADPKTRPNAGEILKTLDLISKAREL